MRVPKGPDVRIVCCTFKNQKTSAVILNSISGIWFSTQRLLRNCFRSSKLTTTTKPGCHYCTTSFTEAKTPRHVGGSRSQKLDELEKQVVSHCQTHYMFLSSEKCLGITMSWLKCLHLSMSWCFSPQILMSCFPGISISQFFRLGSRYRGI